MPDRDKPRRGSLQYWPRRRAKRIYTRMSHWQKTKDIKPLGFAGWKVGMAQIHAVDKKGKAVSKPVTILDTPPLLVCGIRFYEAGRVIGEKWTENMPKSLQKKVGKQGTKSGVKDAGNVTLIVATQPEKSGMKKRKPEVFEIGIGGEDAKKKIEYADSLLGKEVSAKDVFKPGEFADVSSVTKGHGFTGPVRRFGIRIQTRKDQQMHRHVGSIGGTTPRHIDWRNPAAGQYGFFNRTETGKRVVAIGDDTKKINPKEGFLGYGLVPKTFMLIEGSVPGPRKRLVRLRGSVRRSKFEPVEVKSISVRGGQ